MTPEITCCFTGHRPQRLPWGDNEADLRCQAVKARLTRAVADAVDQAGADDDGAAALVVSAENEVIEFDARDARRRRRDRRILIEDVVGALAAGSPADNARARGVDEGLAAAVGEAVGIAVEIFRQGFGEALLHLAPQGVADVEILTRYP